MIQSQHKVVRTIAGRAIHSPHGRLPLVAHTPGKTGYNAGNVPRVTATHVANPLQRQRQAQ